MENLISQYLPIAVAVISVLAFIVSAITELIKEISFLKKIPTNLVVIVLSLILTVLGYLIYSSYYNYTIYWYGVVGSFFGGFIVAYVATYGWEKLHSLWERYKDKRDKDLEQKKDENSNKLDEK